jgi:hypothetical protein
VRSEHALRQHLVARQHHPARIAARVALPEELEVGNDVVIVGNDALELVEQIEDDVRAPRVDRRAQLGEIVRHAKNSNLVAELAQRVQNVVLGAELVDFGFAEVADVLRRH